LIYNKVIVFEPFLAYGMSSIINAKQSLCLHIFEHLTDDQHLTDDVCWFVTMTWCFFVLGMTPLSLKTFQQSSQCTDLRRILRLVCQAGPSSLPFGAVAVLAHFGNCHLLDPLAKSLV
jgi:hypothetical protein